MSVNLGRVAYVEKGAYDSGTTYQKKDVVFYDGGSYVFIADAPAAGIVPTNAEYWQPMMIPARSSALIRGLAVLEDASGDIVTITDGAEGMPVQSLITHFEPVQEGSGDPSPNNIRNIIGWNAVSVTGAGKNLFGGETLADRFQSVMTVTRDDDARTISFRAADAGGKVFFNDFKPDTRYTIILYGRNNTAVTNTYIRYPDGTTGKAPFVESGSDCYAVYTTDAGKSVEAFMGSYSNGTTVLYYDKCGIFEGVLTEADLAEYQGKTLTAALPETVTEGEYDWVNGMLTKPDGSTVQLTPQQVDTLKGVNNIWSNAGETTVTYAADTKLYIDRRIAELAAGV